MEDGKIVADFPNYHHTAEICGGKLVEVSSQISRLVYKNQLTNQQKSHKSKILSLEKNLYPKVKQNYSITFSFTLNNLLQFCAGLIQKLNEQTFHHVFLIKLKCRTCILGTDTQFYSCKTGMLNCYVFNCIDCAYASRMENNIYKTFHLLLNFIETCINFVSFLENYWAATPYRTLFP